MICTVRYGDMVKYNDIVLHGTHHFEWRANGPKNRLPSIYFQSTSDNSCYGLMLYSKSTTAPQESRKKVLTNRTRTPPRKSLHPKNWNALKEIRKTEREKSTSICKHRKIENWYCIFITLNLKTSTSTWEMIKTLIQEMRHSDQRKGRNLSVRNEAFKSDKLNAFNLV